MGIEHAILHVLLACEKPKDTNSNISVSYYVRHIGSMSQ